MKIVDKVWGREVWLVNEPEYCCKLLELNKVSFGSRHYHSKKKETFILQKGQVELEIENLYFRMDKAYQQWTILPGKVHRMFGCEDAVILEVSTHHDDNDVVRLEESKP